MTSALGFWRLVARALHLPEPSAPDRLVVA